MLAMRCRKWKWRKKNKTKQKSKRNPFSQNKLTARELNVWRLRAITLHSRLLIRIMKSMPISSERVREPNGIERTQWVKGVNGNRNVHTHVYTVIIAFEKGKCFNSTTRKKKTTNTTKNKKQQQMVASILGFSFRNQLVIEVANN